MKKRLSQESPDKTGHISPNFSLKKDTRFMASYGARVVLILKESVIFTKTRTKQKKLFLHYGDLTDSKSH